MASSQRLFTKLTVDKVHAALGDQVVVEVTYLFSLNSVERAQWKVEANEHFQDLELLHHELVEIVHDVR